MCYTHLYIAFKLDKWPTVGVGPFLSMLTTFSPCLTFVAYFLAMQRYRLIMYIICGCSKNLRSTVRQHCQQSQRYLFCITTEGILTLNCRPLRCHLQWLTLARQTEKQRQACDTVVS